MSQVYVNNAYHLFSLPCQEKLEEPITTIERVRQDFYQPWEEGEKERNKGFTTTRKGSRETSWKHTPEAQRASLIHLKKKKSKYIGGFGWEVARLI